MTVIDLVKVVLRGIESGRLHAGSEVLVSDMGSGEFVPAMTDFGLFTLRIEPQVEQPVEQEFGAGYSEEDHATAVRNYAD